MTILRATENNSRNHRHYCCPRHSIAIDLSYLPCLLVKDSFRELPYIRVAGEHFTGLAAKLGQMRDDSATRMSGNAEANLGEHATGTTVPKQPFRAPSPSAMAARMRLNQALQKSDQRDDGVSASSSRRDPDRFSDPAAPSALLANSDSTVVKPSEKASTRPSTLRNLADVAGLSLQDTPPQVPVDSLAHPVSAANAEGSATSTDIDPDMLSAISKLVATKQAGAGSGVPAPASPNSDVSSLTRQIEQMAQRRRAQSKPPRPSPEDGSLSPRSKRSAVPPFSDKNPANLDLKHNDNSFHVVADLVLQPFKRGGTLSPEAQAQLHGAVSQQMRESFVEALQYRLKNNCPPGSSQHIHVVTRKCQVLGFDKEASENPLLSSTQVVVTEEVSTMRLIPYCAFHFVKVAHCFLYYCRC